MKEIPLAQGYVALVDDEDYDTLNLYQWHVTITPRGKIGSVRRWTTVRMGEREKEDHRHGILMSHQIMNPPEGMEVDHRNRDTLDFQRTNLRICTRLQNGRNRGIPVNNTSGFKGVFRTPYGTYCAMIRIDGKNRNLGSYPTPESAARRYDQAACKHYGEFACLNFSQPTR
jgi:hypothetical protein